MVELFGDVGATRYEASSWHRLLAPQESQAELAGPERRNPGSIMSIMKHICTGSDTSETTEILLDVFTSLTSLVKAKNLCSKWFACVAYIKDERNRTVFANLQGRAKLPLSSGSHHSEKSEFGLLQSGSRGPRNALPPFNKDTVPSIPAMFDSM